MLKSFKMPLLITAVFFLTLSYASGSEDGPAYGDALVVSSISDACTLVPILASDCTSSDVCGYIFNGLVKYDKDIKLVGDLARSWEIEDAGLTIIFHLRKGVKWHDGVEFTSRDVRFTYDSLIDPRVKTPYSGDYERIKSLEIVDDYTVKVTYKEPFSPCLLSWGIWMMPEHILKNQDLNDTPFARHPIGTGPYKFKSWRTQEKIELVSNHDYFEGRPYIDRYIYRIIPDDATAFLELETEGVDMAILTPLQFARQTDTKFFKDHYRKFRYQSFGYSYLGYNLADNKFSDIRTRQAINYAVDKDEIVNAIFFGRALVTTGPFQMDSWAYNKDVLPVRYDPVKARELLKSAGWSDADGDGWLEKDGMRFEFTVLISQGSSERTRSAEMIQGYLKKIGISMKIRVLEWSALINEFINPRKFEAVLMGWSLSRDPDVYDIWHSSKTREGEFNILGYSNSEVDRLLVDGRRTFDPARRTQIYNKIHELIYNDQPCLFLYSAEILPIVHKRFRGVESSPIGIGYNFIKWYAPKNEQKYRQ